MAQHRRLQLGSECSVEYIRSPDGSYFVLYAKNSSVLRRTPQEVRRWLKVPKGIPSRELLDDWLAELPKPKTEDSPAAPEAPVALSPELLATGFGPEIHEALEAEPLDPTQNTRMVT